MSQFIVGIDVGNFGTKSQHSNTPSSCTSMEKPHEMATEHVFYEGMYHCITNDRNRRMKNKLLDEYTLDISLFAIAKEILAQITSEHPEFGPEEIQKEIDKITELSIGVGTPAGYFSALKEQTNEYYLGAWGGTGKKPGLVFTYTKDSVPYTFSMVLKNCMTFPQDVSPVLAFPALRPKDVQVYYVIGIGGGTVDIIPVENNHPRIDDIVSLELGSVKMFDYIQKQLVAFNLEDEFSYEEFETILLDKETERGLSINKATKDAIFQCANKFVCEKVIPGIIQKADAKIGRYASVIIGGGGLVMKPFIEKSESFRSVEFVEDININAKAYASLVAKYLKG